MLINVGEKVKRGTPLFCHKDNPEVFFVSINASKQKDHPFIDKYKLFNTPTYVLINNHGEKIARRVGTFNSSYFKNFLI